MYIYKQGVTSSIYVYVILNFHYVKGFICLYGKGGKVASSNFVPQLSGTIPRFIVTRQSPDIDTTQQ